MVIAGIAVVCALAALFLGAVIGNRFESTPKPARHAPFEPPVTTIQLAWPTTIQECEDGRWRNFAQFASEAECDEYVRSLRP